MEDQKFAATWNAAVAEVAESRRACATGEKLCIVTRPLPPHERRRIHGKRRQLHGRDVLDSLHYWRSVRRTCSHAGVQYLAHFRDAMKPVKLPAYRKPAPVLHPVFAGIFQSFGMMERAA